MTWSRSTKLLLFAGCLAAVISVSGVMTGFSEGLIRTMLADFYPGPCTGGTPSNITITYEGINSGCTPTNGIQCHAGEEIRIEGSSSTYAFQVCDQFIWTVGGNRQIETFTPELSERFGTPGPRTVMLTVRNTQSGASTNSNVITVPAPTAVNCNSTDSRNLCLLNNRFRVTLTAEDPDTGAIGQGQAIREAGSEEFGYFSIPALTNNPANFEVFVKIVDATGILPGLYWVFYGGLTHFEYTVTVLDTQTGLTETYDREGRTSQAGFDTAAFIGEHKADYPPGDCSPGTVTGTSLPNVSPGTCVQGGNSLCLQNGRFRIQLSARDVGRSNITAPGQAVKKTEEFGWFSVPQFGATTDPQFFVKILDARAFGGFYWLFYSGLTDMEVTLTITDTQTGRVKQYVRPNVPGGVTPCGGFDTAALPGS